MNSEVKIPTLLGLGILLAGLVAGVFLVAQNQIFKSKASSSSFPKNIEVANISATSAVIYWQTDNSEIGFVKAGGKTNQEQLFKDDRDLKNPEKHQLHFSTLTNLTPNTTYYYKIASGSDIFPAGEPLNFQTAKTSVILGQQPLVGTVLTTNSTPVDEALVKLEIPGASPLATVTKIAGNFVLPLTQIKTKDLASDFSLSQSQEVAKLTIFNNNLKTVINLPLPLQQLVLPTVILGQSTLPATPTPSPTSMPALTITATPSATPTGTRKINPSTTPTPKPAVMSYDLNTDGVVNSMDVSIVISSIGKTPINKATDFNSDGVVNSKDLILINQYITQHK